MKWHVISTGGLLLGYASNNFMKKFGYLSYKLNTKNNQAM